MTEELRRYGIEPLQPPRADMSTIVQLERLWTDAGLEQVRYRTIEVEREFVDFEDWWSSVRSASSLAAALDRLEPPELARLQDALRERLRPGVGGDVRCKARANAVVVTKRI